MHAIDFHYSPNRVAIHDNRGQAVQYHLKTVAHEGKSGQVLKPLLTHLESDRKIEYTYQKVGSYSRINKIKNPKVMSFTFTMILIIAFHHYMSLLEKTVNSKPPIAFIMNKNKLMLKMHWDKKRPIGSINKEELSQIDYDGEKQELFQWSQEGWLISKAVARGKAFNQLEEYTYDANGNVITYTLYGNLTGTKLKHSKIKTQRIVMLPATATQMMATICY